MKKARAVPVRESGLADLGVGARGVSEAIAATRRTLTSDEILVGIRRPRSSGSRRRRSIGSGSLSSRS